MIYDGNLWFEVRDGDPRVAGLYARHYSARRSRTRADLRCAGPGEKVVLLTADCRALFIWRSFISMDHQQGISCAVFRNESPVLSSTLILMAEEIAWRVWGNTRLYTYVNPAKISSPNPGYCFKVAGWRVSGKTLRGLIILAKDLTRSNNAPYIES